MGERIYYRTGYIKNDPTPEPKISPALQTILDGSRPEDKHDVIVFHNSLAEEGITVRSDRRDHQTRMAAIQQSTECHRRIQTRIFDQYGKQIQQRLKTIPIGNGVLPAASIEVTRETLPLLAEIPQVRYVMPNHEVHQIEPVLTRYMAPSENEVKAGLTWGLDELEIPRLWELTKGDGIKVAVIDSGVDAGHVALKNRVKQFIVITRDLKRIPYKTGFDKESHGTHVCGTIAGGKTGRGISIGVAPHADLLVATEIPKDMFLGQFLNATSWAIEEGADILNISMGCSIVDYNIFRFFSIQFNRLIQQYQILPVVSVGNDGYGRMRYPASSFWALAVGATYRNQNPAVPLEFIKGIAFFSSGASLDYPEWSNEDRIVKPDVVAPGRDVYSCVPSKGLIFKEYPYAYMNGTSMAAPHVSGVVALLMAAHPSASVSQIVQALMETAYHPNGNRRPDNRWGHGLIRPMEAHNALS